MPRTPRTGSPAPRSRQLFRQAFPAGHDRQLVSAVRPLREDVYQVDAMRHAGGATPFSGWKTPCSGRFIDGRGGRRYLRAAYSSFAACSQFAPSNRFSGSEVRSTLSMQRMFTAQRRGSSRGLENG